MYEIFDILKIKVSTISYTFFPRTLAVLSLKVYAL